jgi:hypothetical protein
VPFVPLVPILGIVTCLLLMFSLPSENWLRLIVWLGLGLVIYFSYGRRHSVMARQLDHQLISQCYRIPFVGIPAQIKHRKGSTVFQDQDLVMGSAQRIEVGQIAEEIERATEGRVLDLGETPGIRSGKTIYDLAGWNLPNLHEDRARKLNRVDLNNLLVRSNIDRSGAGGEIYFPECACGSRVIPGRTISESTGYA